jgi:hypothetical protein
MVDKFVDDVKQFNYNYFTYCDIKQHNIFMSGKWKLMQITGMQIRLIGKRVLM